MATEFIGWPNEGVEYWNAFWRGHADVHGPRSRIRRVVLRITEPIQLALSEMEWQFSRFNSWLREDAG